MIRKRFALKLLFASTRRLSTHLLHDCDFVRVDFDLDTDLTSEDLVHESGSDRMLCNTICIACIYFVVISN